MSLQNVWNGEQRGRLLTQLRSTSRAFAAALPAEEAVDGLIINLHLCLALDLSAAELLNIFSPRTLTFLAGMTAASPIETGVPRDLPGLAAALSCHHPPVATKIGVIGRDGRLQVDDQPPTAGSHDGTIHLIFRRGAPKP
jgi:hypothetical protein